MLAVQIIVYNIFIVLYKISVFVASFFNTKAALFYKGRKNWQQHLSTQIQRLPHQENIWMHCASLGEFEQGRPVLTALRSKYPGCNLILSFYSPSGYEPRKNYDGVDLVTYLPIDTPSAAAQFVEIISPKIALFIKYEFWYNYLHTLHQKHIPTYLIAAIFQERHLFFKWYGALHRKMLTFFELLMVQESKSKLLLSNVNVQHVVVVGDPRFDRAATIAKEPFSEEALIRQFVDGQSLIVAGSTWMEDLVLLSAVLGNLQTPFKLIVAPHNIDAVTINNTLDIFKSFKVLKWSSIDSATDLADAEILVIDNIGLLAYIYRYAQIVWIGGGYNKTGIHNAIEAAVYEKPLFWGPNYKRYQEAINLIACHAAISTTDPRKLAAIWKSPADLKQMAANGRQYLADQMGATQKIMHYLSLK